MFVNLIKGSRRQRRAHIAAFESTSFSLSVAVPRPSEQREDHRISPILRVAKLIAPSGDQLIHIRNLSAGGLMADVNKICSVGDAVQVEFSSQRIPATIVWTRQGRIGVKFDNNIDIGELLAGRKPRAHFRPRPIRLEVPCKASIKVGKYYYEVNLRDISLAGLKIGPVDEYCVGQRVTVVVESLHPVKGTVRWYSDRFVGIVFDKPLTFEELAEWLGKRLEHATLRAAVEG